MTVKLRDINPENDQRWDEFVFLHPSGSIYHHSAWRQVLLATYDYEPFYVALENSETGQLEGILPLMLVKSRITGKRLVSLPFTSYCPCLIPESELENVVHFAMEKHPRAEYLELKIFEVDNNKPAFLEIKSGYMTHILDLSAGQEQLFKSFHPTCIRQRIKRAERNHVELRMAENEKDLEQFYRLHIAVRKKHGLPPHPYSFFANMWNILGPKNYLFVPLLEHQGEIIAGGIVLRYKNTFTLEYHATDQNNLKISPNQLLIWEVIKIACGEGAKFLDFGRSFLTNQTLIEFKERWDTKRHNLMYCYYPKVSRIDTESSFGRRVLNFTNRFLPDAVLRMEGNVLYRHLG